MFGAEAVQNNGTGLAEAGFDIAVVGAGPAGMTAALYGLRAGLAVVAFEAKAPGGQIINAQEVENYPAVPKISGAEWSTNLYNQVVQHGGEVKFEDVTEVSGEDGAFKIKTDGGEYSARKVIIATGAENRKLGLPGEDELTGRGVSYCATCDGNFYKGKDVAVVGGGNTALEDAIYLAGLCNKVYLIHRRDEFRGEQKYVSELKKLANVEFVLSANVAEIMETEGKVSGAKVKFNDGTEKEISIAGIFMAVGQVPKNQTFAQIIELDEAGYVKSEDGVHTSKPGVYVAGDARVKDLRQLTTAVADGSIAATTAMKEMK